MEGILEIIIEIILRYSKDLSLHWRRWCCFQIS